MRLVWWLVGLVSADGIRRRESARHISELHTDEFCKDQSCTSWAAALGTALGDPALGDLPLARSLLVGALAEHVRRREKLARHAAALRAVVAADQPRHERIMARIQAMPTATGEEMERRTRHLVLFHHLSELRLPIREREDHGISAGFHYVLRYQAGIWFAHRDVLDAALADESFRPDVLDHLRGLTPARTLIIRAELAQRGDDIRWFDRALAMARNHDQR
jgi:hypothetical protein